MATRCVIHVNKSGAEGKVIPVPATMEELLETASEKLKIKANKVFSESGNRIEDIGVIRDDENLYISQGEGFYKKAGSRVRKYKIAVIGSGGVGKSCLSLRFVKNHFVDTYDPTIEDAFTHQTMVDGDCCILDILDTAGQEDMQMLRRQWVDDRDGFLMVFSIIDKLTFHDLHNFYSLIEQVKEEEMTDPGVPLVLVGNKSDMESSREVTKEEATQQADEWNAVYIEASAKCGQNVAESFEELVRAFRACEPDVPDNPKKKMCLIL